MTNGRPDAMGHTKNKTLNFRTNETREDGDMPIQRNEAYNVTLDNHYFVLNI